MEAPPGPRERGALTRVAASIAVAVLAIALAYALAVVLTSLTVLVPGLPPLPTSLDRPLPAGTFVMLAMITAISLGCAAAVLLRTYPGPVPLRPRPGFAIPTALVTIGVVASSLAGSLAIESRGELYIGIPRIRGTPDALIVAASACLVAPVVEELFFREAILRVFHPSRRMTGVVVSSAAFALLHLSSGGPLLLLTLFAMGLLLALLRLRTGALGPPMLAHALNNVLAVIAALVRPGS